MMVLLKATGISRSYSRSGGRGDGTTIALEQLSIAIDTAELLIVTGPSGSGKSTLLNILSGLDSSSSGEVIFQGRQFSSMSPREIAQLRNASFGTIFQTPHLLLDRTALENVALPFQYGNYLTTSIIIKRCRELLHYVGLGEMEGRYPTTLSGGEMQRIVVARALARKPKLIFADEPTGSLDSENSEKIIRLLKQQAESGCAVVMATHDTGLFDAGTRHLRLEKIRSQQ
jgi:ABC-type lipoprotein export system ATPase subunit